MQNRSRTLTSSIRSGLKGRRTTRLTVRSPAIAGGVQRKRKLINRGTSPWQRDEALPRNAISVSRSLPRRSLAVLLNLVSRPLTGNSVRHAGSNSPPGPGPRSELRCEPGPDSVHSFFGRFERSSPGGLVTRKVHFPRRAVVFAAWRWSTPSHLGAAAPPQV